MLLTSALRNWKDTGTVLRTSIFSLFAHGPLELGIADLMMCLSTGFCLPLQQMYAQGEMSWGKGGHILQHGLQSVWLGVWVYLPFYFEWQWYVRLQPSSTLYDR